jgi:Uma2 family endonuclease
MSTAQVVTTSTPEDLLRLPDDRAYELVDGQLVEKQMGMKSSRVATRLCYQLEAFLERQPAGWVVGEGTYQCFPDAPNRVRRPDVSFIRFGRLPDEELPDGHCPIAPDIAAEVVSPHDTHSEVSAKIEEYLAAGVALVWIINPDTRTVLVYREEGNTVAFLHENDELTGESVLPGFRCRVAEILPPAKAAEAKT